VLTAGVLTRTYYDTATIPQEASISIISGTALVKGVRERQWSSISDDDVIELGDSILTNESSQVFLRLFDGSTLQVLSASEVRFRRMALSKKEPREESIELEIVKGKAHVGVAVPYGREKQFLLNMGTSSAYLEEGSYTVVGEDQGWQLRVGPAGSAKVVATGSEAFLLPDQRVEVSKAGVVGEMQAAWEEIVFNGDLSRGLAGWQQGGDITQEGSSTGIVKLLLDSGKPAIHFARSGSSGSHGETYIYQEINRDVSDLADLRLAMDLKIIDHQLSGGGYIGSEYPVAIRLNYRTADGDRTAVYGFYTHNDAGNRTDNGQQVIGGYWIEYTHPGNLMALNPRPQKITSIQIGGSGWDYESMIREITITGK